MDRIVIQAHAQATRRAARIGLDLLEIHSAHGYLLSSFLSPLANRRTDAYGGSLENRMRFPLEVFDAVRAAWPADRPAGCALQWHRLARRMASRPTRPWHMRSALRRAGATSWMCPPAAMP
jgi:2,4-dienoyl-CoA reductase-like NADH-dependent reductase (Old Yellow Enzyme family)